jgi:hypothetical protein
MRPPVALLVYVPDHPQQAVYYPFAIFSPEWQAIHYSLQHQIPVRFMDLPQTHRFALENADYSFNHSESQPASSTYSDPLRLLADAAGYSDSERWWEHLIEQRQDSTELFAAVLEAMTALRTEVEQTVCLEPLEAYREAYMRKTIREAEKQGFQNIAVVCGAWHAPALVKRPPAKSDHALLKGLPRLKVEATWIPWTHGRLLMSSGYGAGVESPGWYQHLWEMGEQMKQDEHQAKLAQERARYPSTSSSLATPSLTLHSQTSIRWMAKVAHLLRKQDLDASSASVIEAVRLSETLAALRNRPLPGLPELNEATQTVLCFGDPLPMQLIQAQLIVGEQLGKVPEETPMVPLQQDLQRQQKRLRLKPEATETLLELDLRKPLDLERSHLLHRLALLHLPWGKPQSVGGRGTFREAWRLRWQPEFALHLIEVGIWGNTIESAATAWTCHQADQATLPNLTHLIDQTLLANLPAATPHLLNRLQAEAAIASDITHLMAAVPPLVNVIRYGTVRQLEKAVVEPVIQGLVARICIGLPVAAAALDQDAATHLYQLMIALHGAIGLLQQPEVSEMWQQVLVQITDQQGLHGLLAGRCCRLLFEAGIFQIEDTARRLGLALSTATDPTQAAAWIEGFLSGSGLLLLHNPALWQLLEDWMLLLPADTFTALLPLLRRTFSTFAASERRQMGVRVRREGRIEAGKQSGELDTDSADAVLPLVAQLVGVSLPSIPIVKKIKP